MTQPDTARAKLLLIDGHSVAYRAFFALPVENFSTSTGQHTNAVYGFTSMLINVLRDEAPTHVAVAFDLSRITFRTEQYADYKGTRDKSPEEFKGQVELLKQVLEALNIVHVEKHNYEADDIIGTLSLEAEKAGFETVIITGDRDAMQLVTDNTTVLYPKKGVSDLARMTPSAVEEKYLVAPKSYPELAALVGETSDNLPGVPGVGPKTAAKWLTQFEGLENLIRRADEVGGKAGESFRAHLDDVTRNRRLNALVRDLDLGVTLDDLARRDWDREAVHELFDALEFTVLRNRLIETFGEPEQAPTGGGFEVDGTILASGELAGWLETHGHGSLTGVDVVGHWGAGTGDITSVAVASGDGSACWFETASLSPSDDKAWAAWLSDASIEKVLHDAKGPKLAAWARGWSLEGVACDTLLAAYLLRPDQRSYDLADLTLRHLKRELVVSGDDSGPSDQDMLFADESDQRELAEAAMVRASAVLELAQALTDQLDDSGETELLGGLELPVQSILARMERTGIAVDVDVLESLRREFDAHVVQAEQSAYEAIGKQINLGSPKQLQVVLFDELHMPKTRKTKSGFTTDAEALEGLYNKTHHPFLEHLLAHRDQIKLRQTVDGLLQAVQPDGRIHTTYMQTIAATGRLSSTDPNLQNIPARTEAGRRVREGFVASDGFDCLMTADYSQIEMRIMAHVSGDQGLIEAFRSGRDFHSQMAAKVFEVDADAVSSEQRARIKAMNYGLAYGLSAYGLSNQLGIPVSDAKALMDDYFESFGGVRDFLAGVVVEARKQGYTETLRGRRRHLPDLNSSNRQRREMAERMALNAPIQGSAADMIKLAMIGVDRELTAQGLSSRVLLQVHDELVLEVATGETEAVEKLVREQMGQAMALDVPLDVSVGTGHSWYDAAH